ncbi:hypothetical protein AGMMS50239_21720 [Bacteroidia bacterium]|nr:hypothetical protein AGMMS50239_21720 [Bacteroidia bacterium]
MKQKIKNIKYYIVCALLLAVSPACNDAFDSHYNEEKGVTPDLTLWQLIEQNPTLSRFAGIVKKTGYDVLLSSDQSFTVWAPVNEALEQLDMTDEGKLKNIVMTHIARFKYTADNQTETTVFTLNGKRIRFAGEGAQYTMNGSRVATTNQLASNGILQTMQEQIPFVKNLWEYMTEPEMDSIRKYFDNFHTRVFLPNGSKIIDYVDGMAVYDSLFYETNEMFYTGRYQYGVGFLNNEDSVYSMILPNNTAWIKAYNQRKPYFETLAPNADSVQYWNTQYAIVQDLVFRGRIEAPGHQEEDSLISTRENVFHAPAHLFPQTAPSPASNGLVYITDELKHNYWESWQHHIQAEAEATPTTLLEEGITTTPAKVRSIYISDKPDITSQFCTLISNGNDSKTDNTFLLFKIANTLKAEYRVYAVFAPISYIYPNIIDERTKVRYDIQYLDRTTENLVADKQVWNSLVGVTKGSVGKLPDDASNETNPTSVRKMLLTTITFPEANYREQVTTIRIKLLSRITAAEARNGYNNRMLVDYILLEPVH